MVVTRFALFPGVVEGLGLDSIFAAYLEALAPQVLVPKGLQLLAVVLHLL